MVIHLFKWFHGYPILPGWALALIAILLWWVLLWILMKLVLSLKIRPARVVILAQSVIFLTGALLIFNIALVPVVLIAFHGMALYTLGICAFAALLYFIRVTDQESKKEMRTGYPPKYPKDEDIFR